MKLNIGCGRNVKEGFINIDQYERENKLDMVIDITKEFPFEPKSVEYIYAEQFLEHLDWLDGKRFLLRCFMSLKRRAILRLVIPDYEKIFRKYIEKDYEFFQPFFKALAVDYCYYSDVYDNPDKIKKERKDNPPPEWHFNNRMRLKRRVKKYKFPIEIVNWFVHQYGEHKCLYDYESLKDLLLKIGFNQVRKMKRQEGFDSEAPTRITSSLYVEAVK